MNDKIMWNIYPHAYVYISYVAFCNGCVNNKRKFLSLTAVLRKEAARVYSLLYIGVYCKSTDTGETFCCGIVYTLQTIFGGQFYQTSMLLKCTQLFQYAFIKYLYVRPHVPYCDWCLAWERLEGLDDSLQIMLYCHTETWFSTCAS